MYRDVLQPGDTFTMMMRKMVMAISGIVGILPMIVIIQKLIGLSPSDSFGYARFISFVVIMFGSWIYVKWTHTAPTWLIAFWTNSIIVTVLIFILSGLNYPWEFTLIAMFMAVEVMKTPSVNLIVPVTALLVFGYNFSLGRMGAPYPLMVLPDGFDSAPGELFQGYMRGIAVILMAVYGLHHQT